jgi:hypothetical protein
MQARRNHRSETNTGADRARHTPKRGRSAVHNRGFGIVPDFELVREVQLRATGANIHSLAQHLQIYVSSLECGAVLRAQAEEAILRGWLAANRYTARAAA